MTQRHGDGRGRSERPRLGMRGPDDRSPRRRLETVPAGPELRRLSPGVPDPSSTSHLSILIAVAWVAAIALALVGQPVAAIVLTGTMVLLAAAWTFGIQPLPLLLGALIVILLFPVDLYKLQFQLPFDAEPYRLAILVAFLAWIISLLVGGDAVRVRRSAFDGPVAVVALVICLSVVANPSPVLLFGATVPKSMLVFVSFILFYVMAVSIFRGREEMIVKFLVVCATAMGVGGVLESAVGFNPFSLVAHIPGVYRDPLFSASLLDITRGGEHRASSSTEGPIALGAILVMVLPFSAYLARRNRIWLVSSVLIFGGVLASGSRTGVVMLGVMTVIGFIYRPRMMARLVPYGIALLLLVGLVFPGPLESFRSSFFPKGGILADQSNTLNDAPYGTGTNGRLSDLGPALKDFEKTPILGQGFGTRPVDFRELPLPSGRYSGILDNQWLGIALEMGAVGVAAWLYLFAVVRKRLRPIILSGDSDTSALALCLWASIASFAVAMYFFDVFGFQQVMLTFMLLLALAGLVVDRVRDGALEAHQPGA